MKKYYAALIVFVILISMGGGSYALKLYNDQLLIDNFTPAASGEDYRIAAFPDDWKYRGSSAKKTYGVLKEKDNYFLRAASYENGSQILKKFKADLSMFPILSWKWRINKFPGEHKNQKSTRSDNGASVYAIFGGFLNRKALKYTWSNYNKKDSYIDKKSRMKVFVLRDKTDGKGKWIEENVNLAKDFEKAFGKKPSKLSAIAILTDSDQTRTYAEADYDDFKLKTDHLPEHGGK